MVADDKSGPLEVRVEHDGTGSASFEWTRVLEALTRGLEQRVRSALGSDVAVIGIRFVDADGRVADGPAPTGITLVGFKTDPTTEGEVP
jgi:hypothetical protein